MAEEKSTVQTAVRLPREMHQRLRESAAGVSDEIRKRVERTFADDAIDPVTRELIAGIINLAESIRVDMGAAWHASSGAHAAFAAAVAQRLFFYKPGPTPRSEKEQAVRNLYGANVDGLFVPDDAAEMIGKTHERFDQRAHSYEHLRKAEAAKTARTLQGMGVPPDVIAAIKKEGDISDE